jgi:hypothetical protein
MHGDKMQPFFTRRVEPSRYARIGDICAVRQQKLQAIDSWTE